MSVALRRAQRPKKNMNVVQCLPMTHNVRNSPTPMLYLCIIRENLCEDSDSALRAAHL